jgi:hypothetical protein
MDKSREKRFGSISTFALADADGFRVGWKDESVDLLWKLAKYPEVQFEALHTFYLDYTKAGDTQGTGCFRG